MRLQMMRVVGVEEADDHACIDNRQSHSLRNPASSSGAKAPVSTPENSARTSTSRSNTTRPGPSACATRRSPTSMPAARSASVGMVTWFFELTREVPRRRAFTSCMEVKIRRRWASRNEGADVEAAGGSAESHA